MASECEISIADRGAHYRIWHNKKHIEYSGTCDIDCVIHVTLVVSCVLLRCLNLFPYD